VRLPRLPQDLVVAAHVYGRGGSVGADPTRSHRFGAAMTFDSPRFGGGAELINGWGVKFSETGQNSNERVQHYMLQWQNGQLVTVWPEEFTTNRAKWIPLPAWDQRT
jgi:hypothetical protein